MAACGIWNTARSDWSVKALPNATGSCDWPRIWCAGCPSIFQCRVAGADCGQPRRGWSAASRWPARGRIIQGFKVGANEGINIALPEGTSVKAAEAHKGRAQYFNARAILKDLEAGALAQTVTEALGVPSRYVRGASPTGVVNYPSDLRKKDPNLFEHYGQRKNGAALLIKPKSANARARVRKTKVAIDPEAKDYQDMKH